MNSIWNNNYSAFNNRFPQLAKMLELKENEPSLNVPEWKFIDARNGQLSIEENGIRLHSVYNPEREAATAVSSADVNAKSITVFYGFGLGYHLVEWSKLYKDKKLVIIEPDVYRFLASMCYVDWTEVFTIEQLVLAVGCPAESVLPLIENSAAVNIGESGVSDAFYFDIPAFTRHAQSYFDTVKTLVKRNQRKNEINSATLKKFGKLWCRNSMTNIKQLGELDYISCFENTASAELPFLIVGAGPSLEKLLPHVKELKEKCVIVCVETALRALLRVGVQPDFIILTDPQFWAYRHIAGLKSPESILITEVSTYPAVFRFNCKKVMLCGSQFPVGQFFENKLGVNPGNLGTGGSVASSAWNFAYFCGAKNIYVSGLDFAFPKNQTHIKGSSAEQTFHTISNRLSAPDKFTAAALYSANAVMSKDYNGNPVLTDSRMKMFSWWFESRLAGCTDVKTFTLSPEGLNTPGIIPVRIEEMQKNLQNVQKLKNLFLEKAEEGKITADIISRLEKLSKEFPSKDFINSYPFLSPYL